MNKCNNFLKYIALHLVMMVPLTLHSLAKVGSYTAKVKNYQWRRIICKWPTNQKGTQKLERCCVKLYQSNTSIWKTEKKSSRNITFIWLTKSRMCRSTGVIWKVNKNNICIHEIKASWDLHLCNKGRIY